MTQPEAMPDEQPAVRVTAVPADANVYGDIFGGWLMSQMDLAASSVASRHAGGRAVTIAVEGMAFHRPVFVGDEVSVFARLIKVGRTSMRVKVEAWARDRHSEEANKVTEAEFAFVAVGQDRRPRPVRGLESV
ncbi:acyl-CoA thioesterase [Sphingomonas sp. QA11]|uniref:acyl-CoA thioesterase n=1 Tax=Sphingomonas sp. QA11 TaxID=2950605 RepID=UPI00234AB491|nr:acyl-CoA thioesterase [Sphingomonas sp. QA11]WCM26910.1 acyl-CoA thioesterase [Sphingomonas sp. QA11]